MHSRSLASVVGKVVLSGFDNAGDGGDVDYGAGPAEMFIYSLCMYIALTFRQLDLPVREN